MGPGYYLDSFRRTPVHGKKFLNHDFLVIRSLLTVNATVIIGEKGRRPEVSLSQQDCARPWVSILWVGIFLNTD